MERPPMEQRILVVANRLPVTAVKSDTNCWLFETCVECNVRTLEGLKNFEVIWIGWPGVYETDRAERRTLSIDLEKKKCIPVYMTEIEHQSYNEYCNNILWPMLHPKEHPQINYNDIQSQFEAYKRANIIFANVVDYNCKAGDIVWCHDYHLMLLPAILKEYYATKVGWFLHTPFPSHETLASFFEPALQSYSKLLREVLKADVVGFLTDDYARHFKSACTTILGLECTPEGVENEGRLTRVHEFPMGINFGWVSDVCVASEVEDQLKKLKKQYSGKKVILDVNCLDINKGNPETVLLAFERFLKGNQNWHDKLVLLQIAVPATTNTPECQTLSKRVHEIAERINESFGSLTAVSIHCLDFHYFRALYSIADVVLVSSLGDGMNLVSYELVACSRIKKVVLILSKFAGVAQSLAGALLIKGWKITEVTEAICFALNMCDEERGSRHLGNCEHLRTHTAQQWAQSFLSAVNDAIEN